MNLCIGVMLALGAREGQRDWFQGAGVVLPGSQGQRRPPHSPSPQDPLLNALSCPAGGTGALAPAQLIANTVDE